MFPLFNFMIPIMQELHEMKLNEIKWITCNWSKGIFNCTEISKGKKELDDGVAVALVRRHEGMKCMWPLLGCHSYCTSIFHLCSVRPVLLYAVKKTKTSITMNRPWNIQNENLEKKIQDNLFRRFSFFLEVIAVSDCKKIHQYQ